MKLGGAQVSLPLRRIIKEGPEKKRRFAVEGNKHGPRTARDHASLCDYRLDAGGVVDRTRG